MFFRPQDTQLVISLCRLFWSVVNEEAQGDHRFTSFFAPIIDGFGSNSKKLRKVSAVQYATILCGVVCWIVSPCVVSFSMVVWCVELPCVVLLSVLFGSKLCCNYSITLRWQGYWQVLHDICILFILDAADWGSLCVIIWQWHPQKQQQWKQTCQREKTATGTAKVANAVAVAVSPDLSSNNPKLQLLPQAKTNIQVLIFIKQHFWILLYIFIWLVVLVDPLAEIKHPDTRHTEIINPKKYGASHGGSFSQPYFSRAFAFSVTLAPLESLQAATANSCASKDAQVAEVKWDFCFQGYRFTAWCRS